jgi:chromate transporter
MQDQVVQHYHWMSNTQFAHMLALANALPGPIATKIAAFVGYEIGGWPGLLIATVATVVPSAVAVVILLRLLNRYRQSQPVRGMTLFVQPVISVLMVLLTWKIARDSVHEIGWLWSLSIAVVAWWALDRRRIHPALVIVATFVFGGIVLPYYGR